MTAPRLRGSGLIGCTLLLRRSGREAAALCWGPGSFSGPGSSRATLSLSPSLCRARPPGGERVPAPGRASQATRLRERTQDLRAERRTARGHGPVSPEGPPVALDASAGGSQEGSHRVGAANDGETDESFSCKTLILTFKKGGDPAQRAGRARDERDGGRWRRELQRAWREAGRGETGRRNRAQKENQPVSPNFRSGKGL